MNGWPVGSFPIQADGVYPSESGYYRVRVTEFKRPFTMTFENTR